jgi:hypothetical protein
MPTNKLSSRFPGYLDMAYLLGFCHSSKVLECLFRIRKRMTKRRVISFLLSELFRRTRLFIVKLVAKDVRSLLARLSGVPERWLPYIPGSAWR